MYWLTTLVPSPDSRHALATSVFFADLLPVFLCYYATAVMVLIPNTLHVRIAFLPLTLWSAFHAATSIDIALAFNEPGLAYLNHGLCLVMVTTAMRVIEWSFRMEPFTRAVPLPPGLRVSHGPEVNDKIPPGELKKALWNAWDLLFNLRGCGWSWCSCKIGLHIPPETRPTDSTPAFLLAVLLSLVKHILFLDALQYTIQSFSPSTFGSPSGGTIFVPSLPPLHRYTRSSFISLLSGFIVYCAIQIGYDFCTLCSVVFFRQYPTQWPPIFNEPWRSTSLSRFWAKRWHQVFRNSFIFMGGKPFAFLAGRIGAVMGVFLASGLLHDLGMWGMGRGTEFQSVAGFFLMMGFGILIEGLWKNVSGKKVQGWAGWTWTMLWVIAWSNILVDAWLRRGLAGSLFIPESKRPAKIFLDHLPHIGTARG